MSTETLGTEREERSERYELAVEKADCGATLFSQGALDAHEASCHDCRDIDDALGAKECAAAVELIPKINAIVDDQPTFIKSSRLASGLDISTRQVGHLMGRFVELPTAHEIERYGDNSNYGHTWKISPKSP